MSPGCLRIRRLPKPKPFLRISAPSAFAKPSGATSFRGYFFFFAIPAIFRGYSGSLSRVNSKVDTAELKAMLEILSPAG
jgi:hypothetical protein